MMIVKKRGELARFGLFLVLAGLMAYFVASRAELFRSSGRPADPDPAGRQAQVTMPALESEGDKPPAGISDGANFFAQFRIDREQMRSARREELQVMVDNTNVDAEVRKGASAELRTVQRLAALETQAETMVRAKGFQDVVVLLTESTGQVVVRTASLSPQQAMQVLDTVRRLTGLKPAAIQVWAKDK